MSLRVCPVSWALALGLPPFRGSPNPTACPWVHASPSFMSWRKQHAMMQTSSCHKEIAYNDANKWLISLWGQGWPKRSNPLSRSMQVLHKKTTLCHWQSLYWLFSVLHTQPGKPYCKAAKCTRPQKRNMILGHILGPDLQGKTLNKLWILISGSSTKVFPDSFFTCLLLARSIFSSQKMDDNQTHF
jgi:hypothetical protein